MTSESELTFAFHMLRQAEPDNHLLDCPDAVVIRGDSVPDQPAPEGDWVTRVWAIQCGHGHVASKLIIHALVTKPEEDSRG